MARVDRDLDAILDFCRDFRLLFLEEMSSQAEKLVSIAGNINSELHGTKFATRSQDGVMEMAKKIKNSVDMGESRIRELERKVRDQKARGENFER